MRNRYLSRAAAAAAALLIAGCATSPSGTAVSPVTPAPFPPADTVGPLAPDAAGLRVAERAELTGMELGRMWTFEDPPRDWWRRAYDFDPSEEWLEQVRLASVRYGEVCSASFVSPNGLVMTNHHCARGCIEALSTPDADYLEDGFYAPTQADELPCPDLYLDQLQSVEDVTAQVTGAARDVAADTAIARAHREELERIEESCQEETGLTCQVVSLYHGGRFHLYRFRRFEPVRLVFAPEHQAASFGGDPDNFTYPRYALDVAFVRAYDEADHAVTGEPYFRWSAAGAEEGEVVFVVGSPGGTSRLLTVSQLMYERHRHHPYIVQYVGEIVDLYRWIADLGPDAERAVREDLASMENALKAYSGQLAGLQDSLLVGRKIRWESELRAAVAADPALAETYGDVWDRLTEIQIARLPVAQRASIYDPDFLGDPHLGVAAELVRLVRESARPAEERPEGYDPDGIAELERRLLEPTPVNPEIAARLLAIRLGLAAAFLPPDDPLVQVAIRSGETPQGAAERLVGASRILDADVRRRLIRGGIQAIETSDDPAVRLARTMVEEHPALGRRVRELTDAESVQEERLANALFAIEGTGIPPDATFTLRITDGLVLRYPFNGTVAPPRTSFFGIYERAANFGDEMPFTLPASYAAARDRVDMTAPLNFVATTDITGGNSGSPMLNRDAEIVGVAFDGNIESLPNEWLFMEGPGRTVGVHSAGIMEALRSIYRADALVRELLGDGEAHR